MVLVHASVILPYLSISAIVSTIGIFLCGLEICHRIRTRGTTEGTGSAPFLIAFISCAFWLQYGVLKADSVMIFINAVGLILQGAYLVYYYVMTRNKKWLNQILLFEFATLALMMYFCNGDETNKKVMETTRERLGIACILLNILSIGAPLFQIGEVIRTRSTESMPLPLCVASLVVTLQWLLYGVLIDDYYVAAPNVLGTVISIGQLSLFVIYPSPATGTTTKKYSRLSDNEDLVM